LVLKILRPWPNKHNVVVLRYCIAMLPSEADIPRQNHPRSQSMGLVSSPKANHVRLLVRDFGVGIVPQNIEKLFSALYTTKCRISTD
jgi:hypothetical protein